MKEQPTESEKRLKSIDNNLRFITWVVIIYVFYVAKLVIQELNPIFNIY